MKLRQIIAGFYSKIFELLLSLGMYRLAAKSFNKILHFSEANDARILLFVERLCKIRQGEIVSLLSIGATESVSPQAISHCADTLVEYGYKDEAVRFYTEAIRRKPGVIASWYIKLGRLYLRLNDFKDAEHCIRYGISLNGEQANWYANLSSALVGKNDIKGGLEQLEKAIEMNREVPYWHALSDEMKAYIASGRPFSKFKLYSKGEKENGWYDAIYSNSKEYLKGYKQSIYIKVWLKVVGVIASSQAKKVIDIGCGPGQFAECLTDLYPKVDYLGIDFSEKAISLALARGLNCKFIHGDALNKIRVMDDDVDLVLATEVLEHIEDDLSIIKGVPRGTLFLGTVPSFHADGHLRVFESSSQVYERYEVFFKDFTCEEVELQAGTIYLFYGRVSY